MAEGLRLQNIKYTYPKNSRFSLEVADVRVEAGMCVAVCGENGSGKTTLGKIAAGLIKPSIGRVDIDGESTLGWPLGRIGATIGYLFQEPMRQIFAPTVIEDMTFPLILKGVEPREAEKSARNLLAKFDIAALETATTYTLSRGEQQRLAIAAMLVHSPKFVVLDEPTTGLDEERCMLLSDMCDVLKADGIGILLISHDSNFVNRHANCKLEMSEGRLL